MIWYRYKLKKYVSLDSDFFDTTHTKNNYYRWNEAGIPALYLANSFEAAVVEGGKYHICDRADNVNQAIKSIAGRPPAEWVEEKFKPLSCIEAVVAKIELPDSISHLDFVNDPPATGHFKSAGYPSLTMDQIKRNAYLGIPDWATMKIGAHYYKQKTQLVHVPSARMHDAVCGVFFPENAHPLQGKILETKQITLHALDSKGKRIDGTKVVALDADTFEYEEDGVIKRITPLKL